MSNGRIVCTVVVFLLFSSFLFGAEDFFSFSLSPGRDINIGSPVATLSFKVLPGYYLYRERMETRISAGKVNAVFPPAHEKDDPFGGGKVQIYEGGTYETSLEFTGLQPNQTATLTFEYQGCSSSTCFMPTAKEFSLFFSGEPGSPVSSFASSPEKAISPTDKIFSNGDEGTFSTPAGKTDLEKKISEKGLLWAIFFAFLGGILVSFTPCVYPMIPITLSIIGGRSENTTTSQGFSLSLTYVAGLSLTYALLGLLVASFGSHIRGILQGNIFQLLVAVLFAVLALSMFDFFMLQIPSAIQQKVAGIKGSGFAGVFGLGMISGLMASPCVAAPLAGILAFIAASGSSLFGFLLLLSFSWGMGLILIVIGTFSGTLNSLPRAGEWMNRVKEFYGYLLFGAAIYFVRPIFGPAVVNLLLALLLSSFAAFLGLFSSPSENAPLNSRVLKCWGLLAMVVASAFALSAAAEWGGLILPPSLPEKQAVSQTGLHWNKSLEKALNEASKDKKPIFVDFRADWCTICRELEERVFPNPVVHEELSKMVLLRVDATTNTPEIETLLKKYKVVGLPTLLFLEPSGKEIEKLRIVGDIDATGLLKNLHVALGNSR